VPEVRWIGQPRLTAGLDRHEHLTLAAHRAIHGRPARLQIGALTALTDSVDLRGRGGAGFPFARKLRAVAARANRRRAAVVLVNATEGEPASTKDKALLIRAPHLVLDGAMLAAAALEATEVVVGLTDPRAQASMNAAIAEAGLDRYTRVVVLPERFITGESGALVRGVNGEPAIPPGRRTMTSKSGVGGMPTLLANAETFAQLAALAKLGPRRYAAVGAADEPGTVLLTVTGAGGVPVVVETPTGVPLSTVLELCGATVGGGVLVGGFHGRWLTAAAGSAVLVSRAGLKQVGGVLGAGVVLTIGPETCPLGEVARVASYLAAQSAGQCGPCRAGLPNIAHALATIWDGSGGWAAVESLRATASGVRGRGACAHPDGTSGFVLSALEVFADEVATHLERGSCGRAVRGHLPVPAGPSDVTLRVDWTRCAGHRLCAEVAPELVRLGQDGYPAQADVAVPPWLARSARQAVQACPALALRLVREPTRGSDPGAGGAGRSATGGWPDIINRRRHRDRPAALPERHTP
jgi:NADH:ubiquinone oxidoreductase subunit F (NADH-binding)/ferredoxin